MKRIVALILALAVVFVLCGCGMVKEDVKLKYGEKYTVEAESLDDFDTLTWSSADEKVATVNKGVITAVGPGTVVVTAADAEENAVAEYTVEVEIVPVTSIVLSTNTCEVTEGEKYQLRYTLFPEDASDYGLTWKSSDESVAKISQNGEINALVPGQTTVSIANKEGVVATCTVVVNKALPNFKEMYGEWIGKSWFEVGDDGTWMSFDSNPYDYDEDYSSLFAAETTAVVTNLPGVLSDLGFNGSVYEKMLHTNSLQGRQEASSDVATVSWTYHPDYGLQVMFEVKK